jgi:hypothetical protein
MKLDLQLLKDIMLDAESAAAGSVIQDLQYSTHEPPVIAEHVALLIDDGYLEGSILKNRVGAPGAFAIRRLTMKGHEFIRNARNDKLWTRVLSDARERGDSVSMTILNGLLSKAAEKYFGL